MSMNPYVLLQIKQTANENEIREALKKQIDLYCRREGNRKNNDGEYLHQIFRNAAKDLLDPEKRRKIDEEISKENELHGVVSYKYSENKKQEENENYRVVKGDNNIQLEEIDEKELAVKRSQYTITSINDVVLSQLESLNSGFICLHRYYTSHLYAIIGEDNSFIFAHEMKEKKDNKNPSYYLESTFADQDLCENNRYSKDSRPWIDGQIFQINGVNSISFVATKIIPDQLIKVDGYGYKAISSKSLEKLSNVIKQYMINNPDFTKQIFDKDTFTKKKV